MSEPRNYLKNLTEVKKQITEFNGSLSIHIVLVKERNRGC